MLPIQKNNEVNQKMVMALQRLSNLNQAKQTFFTYLIKINTLQKTHAKKIWASMTEFQDEIVKLTFYSSEKVKRILNFTKIYREFSHHWERISKVNIRNLQQLQTHQIEASEKIVKQKAQVFLQELNRYIQDEKVYNALYVVYNGMCSNLKEDIQKFKSYSDPLCFYNQKFTNEFLEKLKKKYDKCTTEETNLKTQTQLLDHKRRCLDDNLAEVKEAYVPSFEKILKFLLLGIKYIIDPNKDEAIQKDDFKLKKNEVEEKEFYKGQVENLLGTQSKIVPEDDDTNIKDDFKQLFQTNQLAKAQITCDQKFFYDRCSNLKTKKVKRSNEILIIQKLLISQLKNQMTNLKNFESQFKKTEKQTFGSDGPQTFSKKFRKYFGKNFHELYELCTLISERRKNSIERIYKTIEKLYQKLQSTFKQKKQKLKFFENRTSYVLQNLKKIKDKAEASNFISQELIREYKSVVNSVFEDFSKNYKDLQIYEQEMDSIFFKSLQQISDIILKEAINKSLSKIIQKEKNRMEILRQLKLTTQAQTNFYEDAKYEIFFSKLMEATLSKNFKSQINTKQFQQTKSTLSQKEHTLNGMIKHKITCCGVKSQLLTKHVKQSFQCYLINMKKNKAKVFGCLNILSNGISFSQKSINPFSSLLQIILPNRDIDSYKTEVIEGTSVLTINSKKGPIYFYGNQIDQINASMVENIGIKTIEKQGSEKNQRGNSSNSSILGNSRSQSFRLQYQKSTSSSFNRIDMKKSPSKQLALNTKLAKSASQIYSTKELLQKLQLKMKSNHFLSQNFSQIQKELPIKDDSRYNYNYRNGIHKFLLKQKKRSQINGKVLSFDYSWKVTFPENILLKSFIHYETVYIEIEKSLTKIKILHGLNAKNVSLAQKVFYDQIAQMNKLLVQIIRNITERQCEVTIQPDAQSQHESEMMLDPDEINLNLEREATTNLQEKPFLTCEGFFKNGGNNNKFQRSSSNFTVISNKS